MKRQEAAGIRDERKSPLFRALNHHKQITERPYSADCALRMVKRRAKKAGLPPEKICNHSLRGTGITVFLENGGQLEVAQQIAAHADPRTTKLYDRRIEAVKRGEIERVRI